MKLHVSAENRAPVSPGPLWEVRSSSEIYRNDFFRLRRDACALLGAPATTTDLYVLEMPDCVSIVPITTDQRVILVEQYRHGIAEHVLECPGGSLVGRCESLQHAAARELEEETGYRAAELEYLGAHDPNPGSQTNRTHTFVARGCTASSTQNLESFEDLCVLLVTRCELLDLIRGGARFPSATLASLMLALASLETPCGP